jgi:hypothetical protein
MRIKMRGRERNVTDKIGRTLILLGKATIVEEPKPEPKPKRVYKRRDMVAELPEEQPEVPVYPEAHDE